MSKMLPSMMSLLLTLQLRSAHTLMSWVQNCSTVHEVIVCLCESLSYR